MPNLLEEVGWQRAHVWVSREVRRCQGCAMRWVAVGARVGWQGGPLMPDLV